MQGTGQAECARGATRSSAFVSSLKRLADKTVYKILLKYIKMDDKDRKIYLLCFAVVCLIIFPVLLYRMSLVTCGIHIVHPGHLVTSIGNSRSADAGNIPT